MPAHAATVYEPLHARPGLADVTIKLPVIGAEHVPPAYVNGSIADAGSYRVERPHPDRFRDILGSLSESDQRVYDRYLGACASSALSRHSQTARKPRDESWASWLHRAADAEDVLSILTEHNHQVSYLNGDSHVESALDGRREWVASRIDSLTRREIFNPHMRSVADTIRRKVKVWFGDDIRDSVLRDGADGYVALDRSYVVLRQNLGITDPHLRTQAALQDSVYSHRLPHELLHTAGLAEWLPDWMVEVAVEDVNQVVLENGDVERALRPSADHAYQHRQEIREDLLRGGSRPINDLTYLHAISSEGPDSAAARRLIAEVDHSWGVRGAIGHVTRRLKFYQDVFLKHASKRPDLNYAELMARADVAVDDELRHAPEKIFGAGYQKPHPQIGHAALAGAGR